MNGSALFGYHWLVTRTLFPRTDLKLPGFTACGHFVSASKTCGDWYGYINDERRHRVAVMIGDVTGHGVPSALVASAANSFVRTIDQLKSTFYDLEVLVRQVEREIEAFSPLDLEPRSYDPLNPGRLLEFLNGNLLGTVDRMLEMTFFAATYDLESRDLFYSSAGHESPLVYRAAGAARAGRAKHIECLVGEGVRLGDRSTASFRLFRTRLEPGDSVLYYTDGIPSLRNPQGEEFGDRRLIDLMERTGGGEAEAIRGAIQAAVEEFRKGEPLADDLSFVVTACR